MLIDWFKKQKEKNTKIQILKTMIISLQIKEEQKEMYLHAIEGIDISLLDELYKEISNFIENIEISEIQEIQKTNFLVVSGMRKSEAEEKKKELNTFAFLVNNF